MLQSWLQQSNPSQRVWPQPSCFTTTCYTNTASAIRSKVVQQGLAKRARRPLVFGRRKACEVARRCDLRSTSPQKKKKKKLQSIDSQKKKSNSEKKILFQKPAFRVGSLPIHLAVATVEFCTFALWCWKVVFFLVPCICYKLWQYGRVILPPHVVRISP